MTRSRRLIVGAAFAVLAFSCVSPEERVVIYDERYGNATSMRIFIPGSEGPHPGILLVHGGSWKYFDKDDYTNFGRRFAGAGYVAASIDYRLGSAGHFPGSPRDVGCALAYLQNHAAELGLDPARIATFGYSAGAHLTALVAVARDEPTIAADCAEGIPDPPAGVIAASGPMDLVAMRDLDAIRDFLDVSYADAPEVYALASPITHVSADDPPFLLVQGEADFLVPVSQARNMRDRLRGAGVEANMLLVRGAGHLLNPSDDSSTFGIVSATDLPEVWLAVTDFLERHVGGP